MPNVLHISIKQQEPNRMPTVATDPNVIAAMAKSGYAPDGSPLNVQAAQAPQAPTMATDPTIIANMKAQGYNPDGSPITTPKTPKDSPMVSNVMEALKYILPFSQRIPGGENIERGLAQGVTDAGTGVANILSGAGSAILGKQLPKVSAPDFVSGAPTPGVAKAASFLPYLVAPELDALKALGITGRIAAPALTQGAIGAVSEASDPNASSKNIAEGGLIGSLIGTGAGALGEGARRIMDSGVGKAVINKAESMYEPLKTKVNELLDSWSTPSNTTNLAGDTVIRNASTPESINNDLYSIADRYHNELTGDNRALPGDNSSPNAIRDEERLYVPASDSTDNLYDNARRIAQEKGVVIVPTKYKSAVEDEIDAINKRKDRYRLDLLDEDSPEAASLTDKQLKAANKKIKMKNDRLDSPGNPMFGPANKTQEILDIFGRAKVDDFDAADQIKRDANKQIYDPSIFKDPDARGAFSRIKNASKEDLADAVANSGEPDLIKAQSDADNAYANIMNKIEKDPLDKSADSIFMKSKKGIKGRGGFGDENTMVSSYLSPSKDDKGFARTKQFFDMLPNEDDKNLARYAYFKDAINDPVKMVNKYDKLGPNQKTLIAGENKPYLDDMLAQYKANPASFKPEKPSVKIEAPQPEKKAGISLPSVAEILGLGALISRGDWKTAAALGAAHGGAKLLQKVGEKYPSTAESIPNTIPRLGIPLSTLLNTPSRDK